jgi:hypothetical protein
LTWGAEVEENWQADRLELEQVTPSTLIVDAEKEFEETTVHKT